MTDQLPPLAISVRQPWAWAIIYAGKDLENRSAGMVRHLDPVTGPRAIHASKGMTRDEYEEACAFMTGHGLACPPPAKDLLRGGIIGRVDVVGCVAKSDSRWFFGPRALVLRNARPCAFIPAIGALGYFRWTPSGGSAEQPARWMLPKPQMEIPEAPAGERRPDDRQKDLFG
jgi:hypothetical protein